MNKHAHLTPEFVDAIPATIEQGKIYISMEFATAVHSCACGCGMEVVTPFSPTDWKLMFDGVSISLSPSIGNWSFPCRSHYWIRNNQVQWAGDWSQEQVEAGRAHDRSNKSRQFGQADTKRQPAPGQAKRGIWARLFGWLVK
tara:strand:- start:9015 stop:9440 length:426 start_codon:yes stop_codon:yes gene_type:complete